MKYLQILCLATLGLAGLPLSGHAEPCTKTCSECCPASAPCCPTSNCHKICSECCKTEDSCCSAKKSKCSTQNSVPLERGGKKISPYADKGCPRRY